MIRVQPRFRRYSGPVILGDQPINWIGDHRGIADRAWLISQVKYGEWIEDRTERGCYLIYSTNVMSVRNITIVIKIRKFDDHVLVFHAHVLRKK